MLGRRYVQDFWAQREIWEEDSNFYNKQLNKLSLTEIVYALF